PASRTHGISKREPRSSRWLPHPGLSAACVPMRCRLLDSGPFEHQQRDDEHHRDEYCEPAMHPVWPETDELTFRQVDAYCFEGAVVRQVAKRVANQPVPDAMSGDDRNRCIHWVGANG